MPFIVSHPGGNAQELLPIISTVCEDTQTCEGNWKVTPMVEELIKKQLPGEGG